MTSSGENSKTDGIVFHEASSNNNINSDYNGSQSNNIRRIGKINLQLGQYGETYDAFGLSPKSGENVIFNIKDREEGDRNFNKNADKRYRKESNVPLGKNISIHDEIITWNGKKSLDYFEAGIKSIKPFSSREARDKFRKYFLNFINECPGTNTESDILNCINEIKPLETKLDIHEMDVSFDRDSITDYLVDIIKNNKK